jgi:HAMP domain-containing protein
VGYTALLLQLTTALQSLARTEDAIAYYRTIGNPTLANQLAGSTGAATITGPTGVIYDTRSALNTLIDQLRTQLGAIK